MNKCSYLDRTTDSLHGIFITTTLGTVTDHWSNEDNTIYTKWHNANVEKLQWTRMWKTLVSSESDKSK